MNEYRTRKKDQLGKRWMKMERERVNGYFRPNEMLADDEKEKRRDKNRRAAHTFYRTHKTDKNNNADFVDVNENPNTIEPVASGSKESDDYELSTTNELSLTVTLFCHHSNRSQCKGGGGEESVSCPTEILQNNI